jgi:hypothetical protein
VTRLPLFTGSGVARALACPPSTILPQSDDDSGDTTARDAGSTVHRFIERTGALMATEFLGHAAASRVALAEIPIDAPGRDACEALDVAALPFDLASASIELPLAYDYVTDTARVLHDANGDVIRERRYADAVPALRESEIPMTLDAVEADGDAVTVADVKSGQPHAGYEEQVTLGMLAASRLMRLPGARMFGQLAYTRDLSRPVRWEITEADLDAIRTRIASTFMRAEELRGRAITRGDVTPGDQCRWCKARDACPEHVDAARELATMQPSALGAFRELIRTDAGKSEAWRRLPVLEEIVASMRAELDAAVIASPVTLDDGSTLGAVKTERRRVSDAGAAYEYLAEFVGGDEAEAAFRTERTTTLGAIERVAGKRKREVIDALEASGAIGVSVSVKAGIVKAKKGRSAA